MRISGVTYIPRKSHKTRNIIIFLLILLIIASIIVLSISAYVGWKIVHPPRLQLEAISSNIAPEFKEITFSSRNKDVTLSGWYFTAKGSSKTVILAHDYGYNRLQFGNQTFYMIKDFMDKGYNVLAFDFRNSGKSKGDKTTLGYFEKEDILGAAAKAKSLGSDRIALVGFSTGASAGILAAGESKDINAVVADSPYSDVENFLDSKMVLWGTRLPSFPFGRAVTLSIQSMAGLDAASLKPQKAVALMASKPLLLIQGNNDSILSHDNSTEIYNSYLREKGAKAELWQVDGADHLKAYEKIPDAYMEKVLTFLEENMK